MSVPRLKRVRAAGRGAAAALGAILGAALALVCLPAPAGAVLDHNPIGCAASALVQNGREKSQFVDATDAEVRLPRRGDVYWTGSVPTPVHKETGAVRVRIGFWDVSVGTWGTSANPSGQVMRQGATVLPTFLRYVPPGRYHVEGFHRAAEGGCSGAVTVVLAGSAVTNLAAVGATGVAVAFAFGLVHAGRPRVGRRRGRPIKGAVMGMLLGLTVAGVLLATYVVASDSPVVAGLPVLLLVGGVALGAVAPFGRRAAPE